MECKGSVIAVGGAEDKIKKRAILSRFVDAAGASEARIALIPAASQIPREVSALYSNIFRDLGAGSVQTVPLRDREEANSAAVVRILEEATGIFVTGGVQLRLISLLGGTAVARAMHRAIERGTVYCGTSAGAAAISSHMIVTGTAGMRVRRSMVDLAPGLGLVSGIIIDQHFSQRGRFGRLIAAVSMNPQLLGVGIDEDTGAIFRKDGTVEVIGSGQVAILDASRVRTTTVHVVAKHQPFSLSGLQLHLLTEGDRFDLNKRRFLSSRRQPKAS